MNLTPLAADSMGARSMAFLVETKDVRIVIDPSVRLGPYRNGLGPHETELERLSELHDNIAKAVVKADVLTISHYHYDHHEPDYPDWCKDKVMLVKHPIENINKSQRGRSKEFLDSIEGIAAEVHFADGQTFDFGSTNLKFSNAVPHGTNTRLGCVVGLAVSEGDKTFVHTSDVEGPSLDDQLQFVLDNNPQVLACDGPLTYMMYRYGKKALASTNENLIRIITETDIKYLLMDHHLLREKNWQKKIERVFKAGEEHGCKVQTFAEFTGEENNLLEAHRKDLYKE